MFQCYDYYKIYEISQSSTYSNGFHLFLNLCLRMVVQTEPCSIVKYY